MAKSEVKEEQVIPSCLESKKLIIKFYPRPRGFITNPKHILYGGMLEGSVRVLPCPMLRNGDYKNVLTNDEKAFLEEYMGLGKDGLSVYKKDNNYWDTIRVKLEKGENFFDMSSPEDYIKAKVALAHDNIVAPSFDDVNNKITYMFYVIKEGERDQDKHRTLTSKQEAYRLYGKYEEDRDVLEYLCKVLKGSAVAKNTKMTTLQGWIFDILENNPKEFNLVLNDKQLRTKMIINKGVQNGSIKFIEGQYFTTDGRALCEDGQEATLQNATNFLDNVVNQPLRLKIENKIEASKQ